MPACVWSESLVSLSAAARLCEEVFGTPSHPATLFRWAVRGVRRGDRVVRLDTVRKGGRIFTSREALVRLRDALNELPVEAATEAQVELAARAEAALARMRADDERLREEERTFAKHRRKSGSNQ